MQKKYSCPSTASMTNQVIRLFWNLSRKVPQHQLMPEAGNWIQQSDALTDTTSSSHQAPPSVVCSLAFKSLFLTSRHLPSFV